MLNIQGLSKIKSVEIESLLQSNTILCLTETQHKYEKINFSPQIKTTVQMRTMEERRGGGLMILHKCENINIGKINTESNDILFTDCTIFGNKVKLVLCYMAVDDLQHNTKIIDEIKFIIKNIQEDLIILGDFNSHVGFLGPQSINKNGELLLELIDNNNLVMLNGHPDCIGEITWSQRERESTIDFVLVNNTLHKKFISMLIDEEKDLFDLSDHNLLTLDFKLRSNLNKKFNYKGKDIMVMKLNDNTKTDFVNLMGDMIYSDISIENYEEKISIAKSRCLMKNVRIRSQEKTNKKEMPWCNAHIRKEIKLRKQYNRLARNEKDEEKKKKLIALYSEQKCKVQLIIKNEITKYERKITNDIRFNKGNKRLWDIVNTLRGKEGKTSEDCIYTEDNQPISIEEQAGEIEEFWKTIYQQHEINLDEEWNTASTNQYINTFNTREENNIIIENCQIPIQLLEHFDAVFKIEDNRIMVDPVISQHDIEKHIQKLRPKSSPGPDGIKSELLKILVDDKKHITILKDGMNRILNGKESIPASWNESRTILIPKKRKPLVKDLRPIALTNITYKLFMSIIKEKIEDHIHLIRKDYEVQAGFTKKRRITDNLFILNHCIQESFKRKKPLYVISIDFAKAFDSIKRDKLIYVLKIYNIHPKIINIIYQIYNNDKTSIYFNNTKQCDINITSGIRQGCKCSTTLFLLITYLIIEKLYLKIVGLTTEAYKIVSLFFADDGILLTQSLKEAEESIHILTHIGESCGLKINKSKSKILIYNNKQQPEEINGIAVTSNITYLGVLIENKKNCFNLHKKECLNKARKFSNLVPAVIARACNRIMIGKTYWKCAALPSILHGSEIIYFNNTEINKLQAEENKAYRYTIHAQNCTAISALRGDIGSSLQLTRDMKTKLLFVKHILEDNNLTREIFMQQYQAKKESKWISQIKSYMIKLELNLTKIETYTKEDIKKLTKSYDDKLWLEDLQIKSTLTLYQKYKFEIKDEQDIYDNTAASTILFEARTGTLRLNDKNRHQNKSTSCNLCKHTYEDLEHFLLQCPSLMETRKECVLLQQPYNEDREKIIAMFLLFDVHNEETILKHKNVLYNMWQTRSRLIREIMNN